MLLAAFCLFLPTKNSEIPFWWNFQSSKQNFHQRCPQESWSEAQQLHQVQNSKSGHCVHVDKNYGCSSGLSYWGILRPGRPQRMSLDPSQCLSLNRVERIFLHAISVDHERMKGGNEIERVKKSAMCESVWHFCKVCQSLFPHWKRESRNTLLILYYWMIF